MVSRTCFRTVASLWVTDRTPYMKVWHSTSWSGYKFLAQLLFINVHFYECANGWKSRNSVLVDFYLSLVVIFGVKFNINFIEELVTYDNLQSPHWLTKGQVLHVGTCLPASAPCGLKHDYTCAWWLPETLVNLVSNFCSKRAGSNPWSLNTTFSALCFVGFWGPGLFCCIMSPES